MGVKLQILLRKSWRTPEGIAAVKKIAASLGITPTASGTVTLSGEIEPQVFESLFRQRVQEIDPRPPGGLDFGTPGGVVPAPLDVPGALREYVESITVAPPYTRMNSPKQDPP